ncbi:hypothetical protein [Helicobacter marmotae]|uniref:site-specific DNA-methyltransferase (adenine-specific) n=1 Tax=Helicobacter marmotae TaxID=152490 RepID=A0A3D8I159_9HELI|nr:hypothetical protein [Helicobacter marmotae]RDU58873.1 hypothetical protein CQA63_08940 [Helicobacter marmotae]
MKAESIQSYLHNFAQLNQDNTQDLEECFVGFIQELFSFKNLRKAGIDLLLPLSPNPALQAFNFEDSIIYYTTTDIQSSLQEAQSGHKNLAFSLIFTSSHHKADLIAATKAINRAISSYNIIFFLSQEALSIAFATRRESLATKQKVDVLAKITLIKDIALHKPHPAHIKNLHSLTNLYTQDLPLDNFYQNLLEALSIETLNDEFFKEIKEVFLDFCDCITLPQEGVNGGACEEFTKESPAIQTSCHSEGGQSPTEESPLSTKDSLTETLERQLLCHSERSEESLPESLVAKRDSSPLAGVQNDKLGYPQRKLVCHSEPLGEESLNESLESPQRFFGAEAPQNNNGIKSTRNPNSNSSALPRDENIVAKSPQKQESKKSQTTQEEFVKLKREFVLRLLSRLLFCQFLEKKGLISPTLWDSTLSQNYYHEVCEPLFFGTLNTPTNQREYTFLSESISTLLKSIPYLNGGLFAPHKSDYYNASNPLAYINTLQIPNACFDKLFATFARYHFTLSENTPLTQEVGLDPELLGMVFENLLSVLFTDNLKNDKDLRKATGSYYTPREIVSYMCASSLHESLKNRTNISDSKLEALIFDKDARGLEAAESKEILARLEALKILDPACGSGAFPLGMLSELLEIQTALIETSALGRHSSDLENFEGSQAHSLASPPKFSKNPQSPTANFCHSEGGRSPTEESLLSAKDSLTESLATPLVCHSERSEESLNESLVAHRDSSPVSQAQNDNSGRVSSNSNRDSSPLAGVQNDNGIKSTRNPNSNASQPTQETSRLTLYERKLKILQENIFGVDIQPMATEIARLRCFLSLICDAPSENIAPLPNLEFKFVSANSLIPLPKQEGLSYVGYEKDMAKLKALREQTFEAKDKLELESAYLALRDKIAKNIQAAWHTHKGDFSSNPLLSWNPFNPHSVAEFFDSEWMFGIKAGKNTTGGGGRR